MNEMNNSRHRADHVVWDLTRPIEEGPHGPMTAAEAERWRGRENVWVHRIIRSDG